MQMPKATGMNSRRNIPGAPRNILGATNSLPGCEQCWWHGFKVSCGFVRSSRMRRDHSNKERELRMSNYDKIICNICKKWLTSKFLEIPRQLLANSLGDFVTKSDVEEHWDIPKEPQDKEVPVHNDNLGASPIHCVISRMKIGKGRLQYWASTDQHLWHSRARIWIRGQFQYFMWHVDLCLLLHLLHIILKFINYDLI